MTESNHFFKDHVFTGSYDQLIDAIQAILDQNQFGRIVTLNAEMVSYIASNPSIKHWVQSANLIIPDGIGIVKAHQWLWNQCLTRLTGIDLIYHLCQRNLSFYMIGSTEPVIQKAVKELCLTYPSITINGYHHGFVSNDEWRQIQQDIKEKRPDIILIGQGFPLQELTIQSLSNHLDYGVAIGVGGSFDVISGSYSRAPEWVQHGGFEWAFRLLQNPKRLRRISSLRNFIKLCVQEKINQSKNLTRLR